MLAANDALKYFVYPVAVLLTGVVVTGVLIPRLTRRRDNRRKALELKTQLVSEMSEAVMEFVMAIQFTVLGTVSQSQKEYDEAYKTWEKTRSVIGTKLEAYFPDSDLGLAWSDFAHRVTRFYALTGIQDVEVRRSETTDLLGAFGLGWPAEQPESDPLTTWRDAWASLREAIFTQKSTLIRRVLSERATAVE